MTVHLREIPSGRYARATERSLEMPSLKSIATIAIVAAVTYMGIEHYKNIRGK